MVEFVKYHGAGNDFIMVDQRLSQSLKREDTELIAHLCHRRFGIGADGLILLQYHPEHHIEMVYFNSDGRESTLCGNGGRCFAAFAKHLGLADTAVHFMAVDGPHDATIAPALAQNGLEWVELKMNDIRAVERTDEGAFVLNTGSPHYVAFGDGILQKNMVEVGRSVRYSERFEAEGINVNLAEETVEGGLKIRTYERGVEDETLACGTGITAAAIAFALKHHRTGEQHIPVAAVGGELAVRFKVQADGTVTDIWLCGPAQRVYEGKINL